MTLALESVLAKAGLQVDATTFLGYIEDAARKFNPQHAEPALYFSPAQQEALVEVGLDLSPYRESETDARARIVAAQAVLTDSALTVNTAAKVLGVDPSRVRHRLAEGALSGWKDQGGWRLPAWQFTDSNILPGLETVLKALPDDQPALVVAAFMNVPQDDLIMSGKPSTPRQWLLAGGNPAPVAALVAELGTPA